MPEVAELQQHPSDRIGTTFYSEIDGVRRLCYVFQYTSALHPYDVPTYGIVALKDDSKPFSNDNVDNATYFGIPANKLSAVVLSPDILTDEIVVHSKPKGKKVITNGKVTYR